MWILNRNFGIINLKTNNMKAQKSKISIGNFTFVFAGYGNYKVTFWSTLTNKSWSHRTNNMKLIDLTKNSDSPKQVDLIRLRKLCKS